MEVDHVKRANNLQKGHKKGQGGKDGQLVTNHHRHGDGGEHVKEGDVTVNQNLCLSSLLAPM